jgi:hypothetical protein
VKKKKPTYRQLQQSLRLVNLEVKDYLGSLACERQRVQSLTRDIGCVCNTNRQLWQQVTLLETNVATLMRALHESQTEIARSQSCTVQTPIDMANGEPR